MNQKIVTLVFLMVAVVFVAAFAAGDNDAAAASGSSSAGQTVTVIVQGNNQNGTSNGTSSYAHSTQRDIALRVTPTTVTMTTDGHTNHLSGSTAYSGTGPGNNNIIVRNTGSVAINILVRSADMQFSDGSNVFTPTLFTINSQGGSSVNILDTNTGIAAKMPKMGPDSHFNTYLTLDIPFYVHASNNYQNILTYTAVESIL